MWISAYRKYIRFWLTLARSTMVSDEEAEDIVHGVITGILCTKPEAFESLEHIRNYVAKSILNRAIQVKRRSDKHVPWSEILEQEISAVQDGSEDYQSCDPQGLREVIGALSQKDFEIIKYRFFAGMTFAEIGELLDRPISTLKSREDAALRRIRIRLRKKGL